ncbi:hypothetical protein [Paenibacillus oryzae]|nr:hypothetical protein [Paenibacillus oryzae]
MTIKRITTIIVGSIVLLAAITALYGVFSNQSINEHQVVQSIFGESVQLYGKGLYHNESVSMASQVIAQEIVTLAVVVPFLLYSLLLANQGKRKGEVLLAGTLAYCLYMYATYCFVAVYNPFFLVYVVLMSLSFFGFIITMYGLISKRDTLHFSKLPNKYIGYSTVALGSIILLMWLGRLIPPLLQGSTPSDLEHYTTFPIQALDLGIVVPLAIIGGIAFARKKNLGYLLVPVITIKGIAMLLAIDAMIASMLINGISIDVVEMFVFPLFTALFCFNLVVVMKNLQEQKI